MAEPDYRGAIIQACRNLEKTLLEKNDAYGNSALDPVRILSKSGPREQIYVRIDDKLSRLVRGKNTDKIPEDVKKDIAGYLVLDMALDIIEAQKTD